MKIMKNINSKLFENFKENELTNLFHITGGLAYGDTTSCRDVGSTVSHCDVWAWNGDYSTVKGFSEKDGGHWTTPCK